MNRKIICKDCGRQFDFSDGEQQYFEKMGLVPPVRCPKCRQEKRTRDQFFQKDGTGSYIPGAPTMKSPAMNRAITWMCCVNGKTDIIYEGET